MTTSPASQALSMMAPVPLAGHADVEVQEAPLEVVEQPVTAMISLPTAGQMGQPTALVVLTMVGAA